MKLNNLFRGVPLGQEILGPQEIPKNELSLAAAAAIAGGSALISSVGNWLSQRSANNSNASLDKATRDWQTVENIRSRAWSEKMWQAENVYNSPSAQRKRLQEAGYNPWISGSGGMSNVSQGVPAAGQQGAAPRTPQQALDFSGIAQAGNNVVNTLLQKQTVDANVANQNAQTIKLATEAYDQYLNSTGDYKGGQKLLKSLLSSVNNSDTLMSDISNSINYNYVMTKVKADRETLEYDLRAAYGPQESEKKLQTMDKALGKLDEEISLLKKQQNLTDEEINLKAQQAVQALESAVTDRETREFVKRKLKAEATLLENDPMASEWFSTTFKGSGIVANAGKFIAAVARMLK